MKKTLNSTNCISASIGVIGFLILFCPKLSQAGLVDSLLGQMLYVGPLVNKSSPVTNDIHKTGCKTEMIQLDGYTKIESWMCGPKEDGSIDIGLPVVLYFHGNGENLYSLYKINFFKAMSRKFNVNIASFDYPTYGKSEGEVSELSIKNSGVAVASWINSIWTNSSSNSNALLLMYMGYSFGAAVALQVHSEIPNAAHKIILLSPWSTLAAMAAKHTYFSEGMASSLLDGHQYDSLAKAKEVLVPTLVIHGEKDDLIPAVQGQKVFGQIKAQHKFFRLIQGSHMDIVTNSDAIKAMDEFLKKAF